MFASRTSPPRPVLLLLVYGAFLAIVGITAAAQAVLVGAHFSTSSLTDLVSSDAATTRAFVNAYVRAPDLDPSRPMSDADATRLESHLASLVRPGEILRVELRRPDGTIVVASEAGLREAAAPASSEFEEAVAGTAQAAIGPAASAGAGPGTFASPSLLREFLPITIGDEVRGVVAIWRDAVPILGRLEEVRREIVIVTLSAAVVAAALLYVIFRTTQRRLTRQTAALLEATRRDSLTDLLNHGALVNLLSEEMERARVAGSPLGVALIDVDNFRLLNDNHGHDAGDQALLAVADTLGAQLGPDLHVGRYGPDEFLLIATPTGVVRLEPVVEQLRHELAGISLQFAGTERLPVTVSAGLATYPEHAASVTALLAVVAGVLEEAKASGGDTTRWAERPDEEAVAETSSFDVLRGLVIAVDTKDRYTKRHSEDVARYATFIGRRIGMTAAELRTLALAGILHDVGKIGVPDQILRKPGRLTEAETRVLQQHVALGDMIVRDLPDIDTVRAGIRYHHERWDGHGYLDRLEGEGIPLIARILAVADTFSAMTTTRPYRKALGVDVAISRLGDAAGTQLDERLVTTFITGLAEDPSPPLPGEVGSLDPLWLPGRLVA